MEIPLPRQFGDGRDIACHLVSPQTDPGASTESTARLRERTLESREGRIAAGDGSPKEAALGLILSGPSPERAKPIVAKRMVAVIVGAVILAVVAAMYLGNFGLGATKEFNTVSTSLIESRMDDYFARQDCLREEAVAQFDFTNAQYARILYLKDNPGKPGSYLPPRTEYRYYYDEGAIEAIPETPAGLCY